MVVRSAGRTNNTLRLTNLPDGGGRGVLKQLMQYGKIESFTFDKEGATIAFVATADAVKAQKALEASAAKPSLCAPVLPAAARTPSPSPEETTPEETEPREGACHASVWPPRSTISSRADAAICARSSGVL